MLGERLESYAARRARRGISSLLALIPEQAALIKNGSKTVVPVATLQPGDIIEIAPGGHLPTDAELLNEFASFDESALTGVIDSCRTKNRRKSISLRPFHRSYYTH